MTKFDVSGGLRVVLDDSRCVVIEQDRINPIRTESFTVTNVARLVEALDNAVALRDYLEASDNMEAGYPPETPQ